jgi:hypothetical protein
MSLRAGCRFPTIRWPCLDLFSCNY